MRKLVFFFLPSLVLSAGSITISVVDTPMFAVSQIPEIGSIASACVTPNLGSANCMTGLQPSNSSTGVNGSSQSSAATYVYSNTIQPISAQGQISGALPDSESSTASLYTQAINYNSLYVFPSISIDYNPAGAKASADVDASQAAFDPQAERANVDLAIAFLGTSAASFALDPTVGMMSLTSHTGSNGSIVLSYRGSFCQDCGPGGSSGYSGDLIDFVFVNGVVTVSSNSLGLVLPGVGSAANFSLTSVNPFGFNFPNNFQAGFLGFSGQVINTVSQDASVAAPEPGAFYLALVGFGGLLLRYARR